MSFPVTRSTTPIKWTYLTSTSDRSKFTQISLTIQNHKQIHYHTTVQLSNNNWSLWYKIRDMQASYKEVTHQVLTQKTHLSVKKLGPLHWVQSTTANKVFIVPRKAQFLDLVYETVLPLSNLTSHEMSIPSVFTRWQLLLNFSPCGIETKSTHVDDVMMMICKSGSMASQFL